MKKTKQIVVAKDPELAFREFLTAAGLMVDNTVSGPDLYDLARVMHQALTEIAYSKMAYADRLRAIAKTTLAYVKVNLDYRGFHGTVEFDVSDGMYHGKIDSINYLISFQSDTPLGLQDQFKLAVDDYVTQVVEAEE